MNKPRMRMCKGWWVPARLVGMRFNAGCVRYLLPEVKAEIKLAKRMNAALKRFNWRRPA